MSNLKLDDEANIFGGGFKNLTFSNLNVSFYENQVTYKFLLTYEDARQVFLCCQNWIKKATEYYKLETLASDHITLVQDSSESYKLLALFEEDDERRAKMHKRRIDMLEKLVKEINPQYYLQYCQQIWFELGDAYCAILDIKLDKNSNTEERPTPHALNKINFVCEKSIGYYERFIDSVKDKSGNLPEKLEIAYIGSVIGAYALIGRNNMKRISLDKETQLTHVTRAYNAYKAVVDLCTRYEEAAKEMPVEFSLCTEMANVLPLQIKQLKISILASSLKLK